MLMVETASAPKWLVNMHYLLLVGVSGVPRVAAGGQRFEQEGELGDGIEIEAY